MPASSSGHPARAAYWRLHSPLLRLIRDNDIRNVVWLTADLHHGAAHCHDPDQARFQEFVPGPLNVGTFGPNRLDNTFGPRVMYRKAPEAGRVDLPQAFGLQFFGQTDIGGASTMMTVSLEGIDGRTLYAKDLTPAA